MNWKQAIDDYMLFLKIERSSSEATLASYRYDLEHLANFSVASLSKTNPILIQTTDLKEFIKEVSALLSARSQARMLSAIKGFFSYLEFEGYRQDNPSNLLETPKIGRKLPVHLTPEEVSNFFDAIDLSNSHGYRNQAIFELLYACGLRVSELVELRLSDLYFKEDFIKVTGKGNKSRLVPIQDLSKERVQHYLDLRITTYHPQEGHEDTVFLNRRENN